MIKLTVEDFLDTTQLNKKLDTTPNLNALTSQPLPADEAIRQLNTLALLQTIRSLTLPNPTPTYHITKRHLPPQPLNFTKLKQWRDAYIVKLSSSPPSNERDELYRKQHTLYLLHKMELT